jgi:hypothetical protein
MKHRIELATDDLTDAILPCQYDDLVRRRSPIAEGEYRLLWATLEDAIRTYVANRSCSNAAQGRKFEEVRKWFEPPHPEVRALFDFKNKNICDLLGIDSGRLLKGLKALGARKLSWKRYRVLPTAGAQKLAA